MSADDHLSSPQFYTQAVLVPMSEVSKWASEHEGKTMAGYARMPADERRGLRYTAQDEREFVDIVKEHGIRTPIKAHRLESGKTEVWDGHHRYRAARQAGLSHMPVEYVKSVDDDGIDTLRRAVLR